AKDDVVARLLNRYADARVLIIGQYLSQLRRLAKQLDLPLITGQTCSADREDLYSRFRRGEVRHLILSKVGNFAIDLPDANVLTQDAALAEELLARKKLAQDVAGRLSETALLIRPGRVEAVVEELRRMGQTPQVVGR